MFPLNPQISAPISGIPNKLKFRSSERQIRKQNRISLFTYDLFQGSECDILGDDSLADGTNISQKQASWIFYAQGRGRMFVQYGGSIYKTMQCLNSGDYDLNLHFMKTSNFMYMLAVMNLQQTGLDTYGLINLYIYVC